MFFKRFRKNTNSQEKVAQSEPQTPENAAEAEPLAEPAESEVKSEAEALAEQPTEPAVADPEPAAESGTDENTDLATPEPEAPVKKEGFFSRIKRGLSRTSNNFSEGIGNLFLGKKEIDDELLEDIESQLLVADVGMEATEQIIEDLTDRVARKQLANPEALFSALKASLRDLLEPAEQPLAIDTSHQPYVILVVGVNGVGKTTTIGKLAKRLQNEGKSVMLAAGDTFRAAAVEQLQVWGERNSIPVIAQHTGADSASVIYDAVQAAKARNIDVLIADTAGRLHNKDHLMEELAKVRRVMGKLDDSAPHETLLVLDAGTGQNAVSQAKHFIEAAQVSGIALTKLDGTAKGGVIFALTKQFGLPVRFIGVGEGIDDLQPFSAQPFVEALFNQ
ncbi:signal recognition particle-docking protein FtsY [Gilvimarinus chinensis]|uniref:signal recognition particle-docking protein FtsY n=1 Tax=Gilvimarinus chinensis TaxID=396005 RepID=UPI0003786834|nr:signal recognition particle-docking protein FtsY [Gilvimarinus chinensis]